MAQRGAKRRGKLTKVVAALVFEFGLGRDDPMGFLGRLTMRQLMWLYNVGVGWRTAVSNVTQQQQRQAQQTARLMQR